jgi:hypothetical protein
MEFITRFVTLTAALTMCPALLQASVIVNSTLNLTQLQILPASGSVLFLSPFTAAAFVNAQDSLGNADSNFDSQDDGTAAVSAAALLASAAASADAPNKLAGASSFVNIPQIEAAANSTAQGALLGVFQIVGTSGPVSVVLSAALSGNQTLITDSQGLLGTSELIFNLLLPDLSDPTVLFMDNLLQVGPSQALSSPLNKTLTSTVLLDANVSYFLIAQPDSESSGTNAPEPSSRWLLGTMILAIFLFRRHRASRRRGPVA